MHDLVWTGERYLPWMEEAAIGYEHWHRYMYASQFVQNKKVLDIACGEGFGSNYLAQFSSSVIGVDIDPLAIAHAEKRYIKPNLRFLTGSMLAIPISENHVFDVIVSFESIEHIEAPEKFLREVKRLLKPEGVFIVSTPNKDVYHEDMKEDNPFHLKEFSRSEFEKVLRPHFPEISLFGQKLFLASYIWPLFSLKSDYSEYVIERNEKEFSLTNPLKREPSYLIAVAGDDLKKIQFSHSSLIDLSDELTKERNKAIGALIEEKNNEIRLKEEEVVEKVKIITERNQEILAIYNSRGWRIISFLHRIRMKIPLLNRL